MPQEILGKCEKWLFLLTLNAQSDKYNSSHAIIFSEKPITCNLSKIISWLNVSKAFED